MECLMCGCPFDPIACRWKCPYPDCRWKAACCDGAPLAPQAKALACVTQVTANR